MGSFKKALVVVFSLIFGTLLLLTVSLLMFQKSNSVVSTNASVENWSVAVNQVERIEMTIELGKVQIIPGDSEKIVVRCQYPTKDYLDNKVKMTTDRNEKTLHLQLSSTRKSYFFGFIRDKACNIAVEIPKNLIPELYVKIQAGELLINEIETKSLSIDGDIAEIEINDIGTSELQDIIIHNNVGGIVAYLSNLPEKTHASFSADLNIGNIDLHLKTREGRGYSAQYIYNIGALTVQNKKNRGFGGSQTAEVGTEQFASYQLKVDVGEIKVFEDKELS